MAQSILESLNKGGKIVQGLNADSDKPLLNRFAGGAIKQHPHVSGWFYVFFKLPKGIFEGDGTEAETWLATTCEQFTPPTRTLNVGSVPAVGGVQADFVVGQNITRTFTLVFREYKGLPIYQIIRKWTALISPYTGHWTIDYVAEAYKGQCLVIEVAPSKIQGDQEALEIEEAFFFQGVWPETEPVDTAGSQDINANNLVTHNITFHFDGWPLTASADETIYNLAKNYLQNNIPSAMQSLAGRLAIGSGGSAATL